MSTIEEEMKAIKLLEDRNEDLSKTHSVIFSSIDQIKQSLSVMGGDALKRSDEFAERKQLYMAGMTQTRIISHSGLDQIIKEAEEHHPEKISLEDILSTKDFKEAQSRYDSYVLDFNKQYALDGWDYAIAGGCGLVATLIDLLCVKAPLKPTIPFTEHMDGIFNRSVQNAFNNMLPPDISKKLSLANPIYSADTSVTSNLLETTPGDKIVNPMNHRLRALSHDPFLGLLFGAWDIMHNTLTVVHDGKIETLPSKITSQEDFSLFQLFGRMLGHLLSDVNAPSANDNRGMGIPAPFMGLLTMLNGIPVGNSTFNKQIEWMYVNGYDFRQFVVSSISMTIMEVLMRVFYVTKQVKIYNAEFGKTVLETTPGAMNPRFRIMLAIAYGTSSSINSGQIYITKDILNANYASWMGLVWNGFHALKWALYDKNMKLWQEISEQEIEKIQRIVGNIDKMETRVSKLPVL